jgi:hypothetical protein
MLDQDANISFVQEIMDAIDAFLADYQAHQGALRNDLERGLVVSYLLGIMHHEMQQVWDELGKAPAFGSLHPRLVFEDCTAGQHDSLAMTPRLEQIRQEFRRRGWITED